MDVVEGDGVQDFRGTDARRFQYLAEKAAKGELRVINVGSGDRDRLGLNSKDFEWRISVEAYSLMKGGRVDNKILR